MIEDANITQDDIADSVSILSVTFITLQPFSTAIGRRLGPKYWIACMMVAWGTVCMAHAATKNRGTLIALRLLLGAFEAGFVPTSFVGIPDYTLLPSIRLTPHSTTCRPSIPSTRLVSAWVSSQACTPSRVRLLVLSHTGSSRLKLPRCTIGNYSSSSKEVSASSWQP
jgi:hypothetical protein